MLRVRAKNGGAQMDHRSKGCCRSQPTAPEAGVLGRRNVSPAGGDAHFGERGWLPAPSPTPLRWRAVSIPAQVLCERCHPPLDKGNLIGEINALK